ncbi:MAG: CRISPR-associated helicase Cas3', partial [Fimbriimonadales bacterium]|nr:CRISPR-associated helicase Cas3' [Fimbriimonadales bacterium]
HTPMPYYAHTPNAQGHWHDLTAHLRATADIARAFADRFGAGELAYYAGLCHDLGKFHQQFQQYLQACALGQRARRQPHAVYGALYAERQNHLLTFIIEGHHRGMRDKVDLIARLQSEILPPAVQTIAESQLPDLLQPPALPAWLPSDALSLEMLVRMLFSCLVDADFLDTERHFDPDRAAQRGQSPDLASLWVQFEANQNALLQNAPDTPVNRARRAIYEACLAAAEQPTGLFRLTAPTGGGKTRAALGFALKHALRHNLERVIVALPYTSIIDQTARVYREILGDAAVLEHHSALHWDDADEDALQRQKLLSENWDAPIIVTTFVQLFESLFSNKPSACRKVHRLVRSVIVLDEAQTLPVELLGPTTHALQQLVNDYGATVVVCTATQPALERVSFRKSPHEIVPKPEQWFDSLRRVEYRVLAEPISREQLAQHIAAEPQVLTILNSRRDAVEVIQALQDAYPALEGVYHLSTLLCPAHRWQVLAEIRARLAHGQPCRLVATQVVEAGVDLDFPVVMRAVGPLDRMAQAAGRCNREGRLAQGHMVIFELQGGRAPRGAYRTGIDEARIVLNQPDADLHMPKTYTDYFEKLFKNAELDKLKIQGKRQSLQFESVARAYRLITDETRPVIVMRYEEPTVQRLLSEGRGRLQSGSLPPQHWYRQIQQYAVNLYLHEIRLLEAQGLLQAEPELGLTLYTGEYDPLLGVQAQADPADLVI